MGRYWRKDFYLKHNVLCQHMHADVQMYYTHTCTHSIDAVEYNVVKIFILGSSFHNFDCAGRKLHRDRRVKQYSPLIEWQYKIKDTTHRIMQE